MLWKTLSTWNPLRLLRQSLLYYPSISMVSAPMLLLSMLAILNLSAERDIREHLMNLLPIYVQNVELMFLKPRHA